MAAAGRPPGRGRPEPGGRARKYSYDALKILQRVWAASGGQCGKYLKESMPLLLDLLEGAGELDGEPRYGPAVRAELEAMSAATIDRYLAPVKARAVRGRSTTKAGPLLRSSIKIRRAGDEVEAEPGFFEVDTVAHCGPVLKGEFARTVNMTDVLTGWTFTRSIRNNAEKHIISALGAAVDAIPFPVLGMDFDNGSEFINHGVVRWAGNLDIYFTRSRPYRKNDQATIESKNNHVVRRYAFYYRYDTDAEHRVPDRLWELVDTRVNYPGPHPQAHRVGRRQGGQAQAPVRPAPHTPGPAAGHRRPDRRPEGRIDRLPQPAQPRRHHPPHHRAPGRPRPPGQGQDRPAPPRPDPQHPARRPQGHPGQESLPGRPRSRGQFHVRHRRSFAGTLT